MTRVSPSCNTRFEPHETEYLTQAECHLCSQLIQVYSHGKYFTRTSGEEYEQCVRSRLGYLSPHSAPIVNATRTSRTYIIHVPDLHSPHREKLTMEPRFFGQSESGTGSSLGVIPDVPFDWSTSLTNDDFYAQRIETSDTYHQGYDLFFTACDIQQPLAQLSEYVGANTTELGPFLDQDFFGNQQPL